MDSVAYVMAQEGAKPKIGIAGLIGVGKSTLSLAVAEKLGVPFVPEPLEAENPFLLDFYKDMRRWGFTMQMSLLRLRLRDHLKHAYSRDGAVHDRTMLEDLAFADVLKKRGDMTEAECALHADLFRMIEASTPRYDVILWLRANPSTCLARIRERNRDFETGITLEYLEDLEEAYEHLFARVHQRVIRIDWEEYRNPGEVADIIRAKMLDHAPIETA